MADVLDVRMMKHAKNALLVQDACNLSGVVHSLNEIVSDIWEVARRDGHGTEWVNHHPIVIAFVDKLASLCGIQGAGMSEVVFKAFDECESMVS